MWVRHNNDPKFRELEGTMNAWNEHVCQTNPQVPVAIALHPTKVIAIVVRRALPLGNTKTPSLSLKSPEKP
jgi:hypothetical protein